MRVLAKGLPLGQPVHPPRKLGPLLLLTSALLSWAATAEAQWQMATGSYTGNGTDNRAITGLPFTPDVVIIKADANPSSSPVLRTSAMIGDLTKDFTSLGALEPDLIQSLDANGFTIGTDKRVNNGQSGGTTYYWTAFKAAAGSLKVGSYSGDGLDHRSISVGFQPEWVIVTAGTAGGNSPPLHHSSSMPNDFACQFTGFCIAAPTYLTIEALEADGFKIRTDTRVNKSGETYYYIAWRGVKCGSYVGDGTDNRSITQVGFRPEEVIVQGDGQTAIQKTISTGPQTDFSLLFAAGVGLNNGIQALEADGFQVGTTNEVNKGGASPTTYYYVAFDAPTPTAVRLASLGAVALDGAVLLEWQTASELDNLGFDVYRGGSADGPWTKLNASMIPGLGSSPEGKSYSFLDSGLTNGMTYFYRLEDVDRSGQVTSHGPVSATPQAGAADPPPAPGPAPQPGPGEGAPPSGWTAHGDPADVSLRVVERTARSVSFELRTGGFYSQEREDGTVKLIVPGFFDLAEPGYPTLPTRRTWTDAVVGLGARVASVAAEDLLSFDGLVPARAGAPTTVALRDGTYRASFRPVKAALLSGGLFPRAQARVLQTAFLGETKRAYLELAPLRLGVSRGRLVLARRMLVTVAFDGVVPGETGTGSTGRSIPLHPPRGQPERLIARLLTRARGLYSVAWEDLFPSSAVMLDTSSLRLSRQGVAVAFHVEPRSDRFVPGSTLFFLSEGAEAAYGNDAVYELAVAPGGVRMARGAPAWVPPSHLPRNLTSLPCSRRFETNADYVPGLLEAKDPWLWSGFLGGSFAEYPFSVASLAPGPARLTVDLQGGSDTELPEDHHVRVSIGGVEVAHADWDGMKPFSVEAEVPPGLLVEGSNTLRLDSDGQPTSAVYLDGFTLDYPHAPAAEAGILEGKAIASGGVEATGFSPGSVILDLSGPTARWLGRSRLADRIVFAAEAGHHYLAVSPAAILHPELRTVTHSSLRSTANQADWIVIAPEELLPAAEPLLLHREAQGLAAMAVSLEQVYDSFDFGEASPLAVRDLLAFAYHHWTPPAPRYVLLLGDASYDPKGFLSGTSRRDLLPTPLTRTSFLFAPSDPLLASVNGDDLLPDLALGRITAGSLAEAEAAVQKILDFENAARTLDGKAVLVADDPDKAGDFEENANDIASLLPSRPVREIFLTQYGSGTKGAVVNAFDSGASLLSYIGHGSQVLWANWNENVFSARDVDSLQPQPAQPLVLTMTCSNGYFISPWANSMAEQLTLAPDKGAIAAFSPSGLSLDDAAQVYHRALVHELEYGQHSRIGDLVLAAQRSYLDSGAVPELLSIYHLFGDPALKVR